MKVKTIVYEDFTNYKVPGMFVFMPTCTGKCCVEQGIPLTICQNNPWNNCPVKTIDDDRLCRKYLSNPITKAVVFGGLEPLDSIGEMCGFIKTLRSEYHCDDTIVIYTGYTERECEGHQWTSRLVNSASKNLVIKFGRYVPNETPHFDEVLGVNLASNNQYAKIIV